MAKPTVAPVTGGGVSSGYVPPRLPSAGGGSNYNPNRNLRPYGQIGKLNAGFFSTSVQPRMTPSGSYFDPDMTEPPEKERVPFADVPVLGNITQGVSSLLGSSLIGDIIAPEHMWRRGVVWEQGAQDPERAKWQRMVDTNAISLADAQARYMRENLARSGKHDLFLDIEAPGDNSGMSAMASKLLGFVATGQRITQKSGIGFQLGPVTVGGINIPARLAELDAATDEQLENNPILIDIRDAHKARELSDSRTIDQLIVAGFGTQNPTLAKYGTIGPLISLAEELTTDPISILEIMTGTLAKGATIAAKQGAKAIANEVPDLMMKEVMQRMATKGYSVGRRGVDHMFVREMMSSPDTLAVLERATAKMNPASRFLIMDAPRIHALGTKINVMFDPLSFFGRDEVGMLTTRNFSNKAAQGVIDGFGARNVRAVRATVASQLGEEAARKLDDAFDVAGMNVALQVGADHSMHHVRASQNLDGLEDLAGMTSTDINQIAMGNARRMGPDLRRVVADKTDRIRLRFVPLEHGRQGVSKMMGDARARAAGQLSSLTGVADAEARRVVNSLTEEQLAILDFQHYGKVIDDFTTAREVAQQAGEMIGGNEARRATFLGPRQLTTQGFKEFKKAVKKGNVGVVRQMIEDYDSLYAHFSLDMGETELMEVVRATLSQIERQLPTEIVDMATVPDALRAFFDKYTGMGYRLGMMPLDEDLMRPIMKDGRVVSVNPWVDFVNERLAHKNISRYMVNREMLFRSISGATIVRDAKNRFIRLGAERLGLSAAESSEMFRAIDRTAREANLTPRGLDSQAMWDAVWRSDLPAQARSRISERQIAELVLEAHEGSLKYVGVSQKFTGMAKTALYKMSGSNFAGSLAENIYPKLRFMYNPMFQAMEFVETPVLLLLRGYLPVGDVKAAFTKAGRDRVMDEIERTHLVMDIMDKTRPSGRSFLDTAWEYTNSFIRASERVINAALAERGMTTRMGDIFGRFRPNVHAVKRWGEARAFEYRMADEMHGAIAGASQRSWDNYATWLKQRAKYNNDRTAIRHFMYDIVARGNPEAAYARLGPGAFKPEHLGATARIMPQFVMSLTEGQEAASGLKWADYRKRVMDRNDPLTLGRIEDALREVQADPHYIERVLASVTAPTPKEFYKALRSLGRGKDEIVALQRWDREMAQARGLSLNEYISTRYAQSPGTVDSMGNITQPTLFQQIADAAQRRGKVVLDHESPERIEMTRIISEMMDGIYDEAPPGTRVKDMTPAQKKFHMFKQANVQRYGDPETGKVGNPEIGLPPTGTIRAVNRAEWPELQNRIEMRIEALRRQADETEAATGHAVRGLPEAEDSYITREFEGELEQDLSDWTDGLIGTYGNPNSIESFDLPLRQDWEGAPEIEIAGYTPRPKPGGEMIRVYAQYDEEGIIAGYTMISMGDGPREMTADLTRVMQRDRFQDKTKWESQPDGKGDWQKINPKDDPFGLGRDFIWDANKVKMTPKRVTVPGAGRDVKREKGYVYHGTDAASLAQIAKEGVVPGHHVAARIGTPWEDDPASKTMSWWSTDLDDVFGYRTSQVVIRTRGIGFEVGDQMPTDRTTRKVIPANYLDFLNEDGEWEPLVRDATYAQAVLQTRVRPDVQRRGVASALYDQATDDGIPMRDISGTWGVTGEGKPFSEAYRASRENVLPPSAFEIRRRQGTATSETDAYTEMVPVSVLREFLRENREGTRKAGQGATDLGELTEQMRTNPVEHPLTLAYDPVNHQMMVDDGNTRVAAAVRLNMDALPAVVVSTGPQPKSHFKMRPIGSGTPVESKSGDRLKPSDIGLEIRPQDTSAADAAKKIRNKANDMERRLGALMESDEADKAVQRAIQKAYDDGDIEEGQRLQRTVSAEGASGAGGAVTDAPNVVVRDGANWHRFGPVTGDDWWEQVRNVLGNGSDESPMLRELADWYHDMRRGILAFVNNDPKEAARLLTGFGVSQLNTSPTDGMRHLLRAIGIHGRGDPLPIDKRITGLNSALMKTLLEDETLVPEGLGQKLMDFIDSLAGKQTRTAGVHGPDPNNPWQPVAGDIWAKRDLGYVDAKMAGHIAYMYGVRPRDVLFDKEIGFVVRKGDQRFVIPMEKVTGGSPSDVEYDHVVEFYNLRKDEANAKGWMGRSDWTAAEMQAVGWFRAKMAMGDATGSPLDAMYRNRHNVAWEAVPSTKAALIEQFPFLDGAPEHVIRYVTEQVGRHVANEAADATGVRVIAHYGATGPWTSPDGVFSLTPNMMFEIATGTPDDVFAFTASMAYLTQQEGIPASRLLRKGKSGKYLSPKPGEGQLWAVDWAPPAGTISTKEQALAVLDQLVASREIVKKGAAVIRYDDGSYAIRATAVPDDVGRPEWWDVSSISAKDFKATWTDEMIGGAVDADGVSFVPERVAVESSYHYHNWKEDPSGQGILDALRERGYGSTADKLERGAQSRTRLIYEHAYQRADPEGLAKWRAQHVIDDPAYEQRAGALLNADLSDDDVIARGAGAIQSGDLLFQRAPRGTLGAISFDATARKRASLFLNPNGQRRDTLLHELSHQFAEQELDPSARLMLLDVYNAAVGNNTLTRRGRTPGRNAAGRVPATDWNEDVHEWFADQFVAWMRNGEVPDQSLEPLMEFYATYLKRSTSYAGVLSPEVKSILDDLAKRPLTRAAPYNTDEAALFAHAWGAATRAQRRAKDLVYFKGNRSWLERSLNHPYFGLYPLSYMWGKILPDLLNFMMFKPFGFEAPFVAFNLSYRMYRQTMQQVAYDEEMQQYLEDNEPALRALAMFIPGLPWDLPANAPLYLRRAVEALATQDAKAAAGEMKRDGTPYEIDPTEIDYGRIISESLQYAFGPYKGVESLIDAGQGAATIGGAAVSGALDQALPASAPRTEEMLPPMIDQQVPTQSAPTGAMRTPQMGSGTAITDVPSSPVQSALREEMADAQEQLEDAFS